MPDPPADSQLDPWSEWRKRHEQGTYPVDHRGTGIRQFLVGLFAAVLLVFGPIDHSWPFWLGIRTGYLVALPVALWFLLRFVWVRWQPDSADEDRLKRTVAGALGGALLVGGVLVAQAAYHDVCTQTVNTRDGSECVGDYVRVKGPDVVQVVFMFGAASVALWLGMRRDPESRVQRREP